MSITQSDKIDSIGVDKSTGNVILTITDHLDWENETIHLLALQEKINCYIEFIESGQILESYPNSKNKNIIIEIISKYNYPINGSLFLEEIKLGYRHKKMILQKQENQIRAHSSQKFQRLLNKKWIHLYRSLASSLLEKINHF